jgi:hypothetical protein
VALAELPQTEAEFESRSPGRKSKGSKLTPVKGTFMICAMMQQGFEGTNELRYSESEAEGENTRVETDPSKDEMDILTPRTADQVIEREWQQLRRKITNEGLNDAPQASGSNSPREADANAASSVSVVMEREWQQLKRKITNEGLRPMYDTFSTQRNAQEGGEEEQSTPLHQQQDTDGGQADLDPSYHSNNNSSSALIIPSIIAPRDADDDGAVTPTVKVRADSDPGSMSSRTPFGSSVTPPPTLAAVAVTESSGAATAQSTEALSALSGESEVTNKSDPITSSPLSPEFRRSKHSMQYLVQAGLVAGTPSITPAGDAVPGSSPLHKHSPIRAMQNMEADELSRAPATDSVEADTDNKKAGNKNSNESTDEASSEEPSAALSIGVPKLEFPRNVESNDYEQVMFLETPVSTGRRATAPASQFTNVHDVLNDDAEDVYEIERRLLVVNSSLMNPNPSTPPMRRRQTAGAILQSQVAGAQAAYSTATPSDAEDEGEEGGADDDESYLNRPYANYEEVRPSEMPVAEFAARNRRLGSCTGSDELLRLQFEHGVDEPNPNPGSSQSARSTSGNKAPVVPSGSQSARTNSGGTGRNTSREGATDAMRNLSIGIPSGSLLETQSPSGTAPLSPTHRPFNSTGTGQSGAGVRPGLKRVTSDGALSSSFSNAASRCLAAAGSNSDHQKDSAQGSDGAGIISSSKSLNEDGNGRSNSANRATGSSNKLSDIDTQQTNSNTKSKQLTPNSPEPTSRRQSIKLIEYDIPRTFPTLAFFHDGGPLHVGLVRVLKAYACYRADVGYVQGMSYIVSMLLLYMDELQAFQSLANLLSRRYAPALFVALAPKGLILVSLLQRKYGLLSSQEVCDRCLRDVL